MASPLESQIKNAIYRGFKGRLLVGSLRREAFGEPDEYGDPTPGTVTTYSFEGFRDEYSAFYRGQAGIPETDSKIMIIAGSLAVEPSKDDKLLLREQWFQIRRVTGDPAGASFECQCFQTESPE